METDKNYFNHGVLLTLLVVVVLLALFFVPPLSCGEDRMRRVNMLSDVMRTDSDGRAYSMVYIDSIQGHVDSMYVEIERDYKEQNFEYKDSIPDGMVAIEDFADSLGVHREMDKFYKALGESNRRQVRIAFFGDSYIEGDIFTSALRNLLQEQFGGRGVGFVEVSNVAEGFRNTVVMSNSGGWSKHHATDKSGFDSSRQSMAGSYFFPGSGSTFSLTCQSNVYADRLSYCDEVSVFFDGSSLNLSLSVNGNDSHKIPTNSGAGFQRYVLSDGNINKATLSASGSGIVYGMAMDGKTGIALDNYSMRGSVGYHLCNLSESYLKRMYKERPYDLIVFEYGLNIANKKQVDYSSYVNKFSEAIRIIQKNFPECSILVLGASDRDERRDDGKYHTMKGVENLIKDQKLMASNCGVAFWDMREALGGDGAISKLNEQKMAAKDMIHINFKGGEHLAKILYDVLMNGKWNYDRRMGK